MEKLCELYALMEQKMKKVELSKIYVIGLSMALVVLLIPMYITAFYNVISHSDDFGHALNVHLAWVHNPSFSGFIEAVVAAYGRMRDIYLGWGGNYTSFFFSAFQPIAFSEKLNFVGTFIFLTCFLIAQYRFLKEVLVNYFGIDKRTAYIAFLLVAIMGTQYLTSARQAFFWYSGCVTNTLGFAGGLAILRILLKVRRERTISNKEWIWGCLLAVFVGGCNYSSMMSLFIIVLLYLVDFISNKMISVQVKGKISLVCLLLFVGGIISIIAPGNAARQLLNNGTNAINAIYMAIIYGRATFLSYFDYKILLCALLILPFVYNALDAKKEYKYPLLVLFISCAIFCAAFAPTMKSDMSVGNRRTRNLYWWIYLNLLMMNYVYCLGWIKNTIYKWNNSEFKFTKKVQINILAIIIFLGLCTVKTDDIKYMPSVRCVMDIVSGRLSHFKAQMEERNQSYYSDDKEITVHHIEYLPYIIFEDKGLFANDIGEVYESEYYEKDKIVVVE